MRFWRKRAGPERPKPGDRALDFQLPSIQGGLFRLRMRTAHGPVALIFVNAGEESRVLLQDLKAGDEEFRRAGASNYSYPNPEIKTAGKPHSRAGTTVALVVRAAAMEPVREMQRRLDLPYYALWDAEGRVSAGYGVTEEEIVSAVVETDGRLAWLSEPDESPRAEQILPNIRRTTDPPASNSEVPTATT